MEYRILPRTGWKISAISFGCMSLEERSQVSGLRSQGSKQTGSAESGEADWLLHRAVDLGINYFDTADLYDQGQNEIIVGRGLRAKRKEVYLATKAGNQLRPDGSGWDWNPRKDYILKAVEESLKRLGTDYIDLYQLHGGTINDPIDETIEAFERLKEQGKIRAYGISSIRPNVIREYVKRSNMVSVMMQYSLLDRRPEESCLPLLEEHDIGVMVRGAVAKGLLVDKPAKEYLGYSEAQTATAREAIRKTSVGRSEPQAQGQKAVTQLHGEDSHRTPAQTALQFALQGPAVCSVVAGMRTQEQLLENVGAVDTGALTLEEYQELKGVLPPNVYEQHRL